MELTKFQKLREAIKNPPADRLAKIEYKSHFYNMIGVSTVCAILIYKGFWWVIFALIFSLGVSYSQGMTAYKKFQIIKTMMPDVPIEKEISPSRKRDRIIRATFKSYAFWIVIIFSTLLSLYFIPKMSLFLYSVTILATSTFSFALIYYFPIYGIANYFYKRKLKGGKK